MRLNLALAFVGLLMLCAGLFLALGLGWALVAAGAASIGFGLLRDDGRETP